MPSTLTKAGIEFNSAYLYKETNPLTGAVTIYANVGYTITTNEGEIIKRDLVGYEVTGGARTRIVNLFADLKTLLLAQEGI